MKTVLVVLLSLAVVAHCFIIMKDGYFYDDDKKESFIPRGISYQTFVQDIGQWITYPQIEYDLREMRKANINSVRVDFAWRDIESSGEGDYKWERFDFLVNTCERYDMKMLVLIGYQWPPNYFLGSPGAKAANLSDSGWFSIHPPSPAPGQEVFPETYIFDEYWVSDVMSFTHPQSIAKYQKFLGAVAGRYKNSKAITGWVVGNEYGFLGLWSFRFDGYEQSSLDSFHKYLEDKYKNNIKDMNAIWRSDYQDFNSVQMPIIYDRDDPSWADLVQWREDNVANFIAQGAKAVRAADPNHLLTYSMVGMIFGGTDWMYQAEDNKKIAYACRDAGAPLAFWAINNYPSSYPGNELRTATFGIEYAKKTGLPTVYSETGSSSTDAGYAGFDDPEERQGKLLRNNAWEAYTSGIIGVHIFTWPDRDYITVREYGFGILKRYREPKKSYRYMQELFYQIALIEQHLPKLFTSLHYASYDVAFYWPSSVDVMYNRYQNNMAGVWGPMTRLGLRCRFMNETQLYNGDYNQVKVLVLPRNQRLHKGDLQFIYDKVIAAGVNVYSECDLPGYEDYYVNKHDDFVPLMDTMFGIKPITVNAYQDNITVYDVAMSPYVTVELQPTQNMLPMRAYTSTWFGVWKYHKVMTTSGHTLVNMLLQRENNALFPGIVEKQHPKAKAIISMFSLGDTNCEKLQCWTNHYMYYKGLFLTDKGLNMQSDVSVDGSAMVQSYLIDTFDNMKLLYIHNWDDYSTTHNVKFTMPSIIGMTVKDLLDNRRVYSDRSNGELTIDLGPNDMRIFLINEPLKPTVQFIYNQTNVDLVPDLKGTQVAVKFDTSTTSPGQRCVMKVELLSQEDDYVYAKAATYVSGVGWTKTILKLTDYSIKNQEYLSSQQGQHYYYRASIKCPGFDMQSSTLNTLLSWPVQPKSIPTAVQSGQVVKTLVQWENLPISRLAAFQGVVAVWNSTKTGAIDPTHYQKVAQVAKLLESIGYTRSRMVAWDEGLQDFGPLYHVFNDTIPNDPSGKGDFSPKYYSDLIRFIVLPGVSVMSDVETRNLNIWAKSDNFTDLAIVSTEGCPGRFDEKGNEKPDRLADVFGVAGLTKTTSAKSQLTILNANHPTTHGVGLGSYPVASGNVVSQRVNGAYSSAQGQVTAEDGTSVPAMVVNQISDRTKALVFNFDPTDASVSESLNLKTLWKSVSEWMHTNSKIFKLRWEAKCVNDTIGSTEAWIVTGTGSQMVSLTPTKSCSEPDLKFYGLMYYWNDTDPWHPEQNKGYFTSENDDMEFSEIAVKSSASGIMKQWNVLIVVTIVTILFLL